MQQIDEWPQPFVRPRSARLSKVVFFWNFSRFARERVGYLFKARFAHLSKVVFFLAILCAPVRGMQKGKLLLLCSRERGVLIQGSLCSPLKSGVFFSTCECTSQGYVRGILYFIPLFFPPYIILIFLIILHSLSHAGPNRSILVPCT